MAIKLENEFPGRTIVNGSNPFGTFKDSDPPGSLNGTPGDSAWARDMWSILEKIMAEASETHNGSPDDATASQRYDALVKSARDVWPIWDSTHTYSAGVITVGSDDNPYYSLQSANLNQDPISSLAWWRNFSFESLRTAARTLWPIWDTIETYPDGVGVVGSDGNPYYSIQAANSGNDPTSSPTWWQLFSYDKLKSDARNVWPIWESTNIYIKSAITIGSDEKLYESLQNSNQNHNPISSPTWWTKFGVASDATETSRGIVFLSKRIILSNNTTSPNTDIDTAAGSFILDDGTAQYLAPAFTKELNNTWALGSGNGANPAQGFFADSTYHFFALTNNDGTLIDFGVDNDPGGATLLAFAPVAAAGLTKLSYLGAVLTKAAAAEIIPFSHYDRWFELNPRIHDHTLNFINVLTGPTNRILTVPNGIKVLAHAGFTVLNQGGTRNAYLTDPDTPALTPVESTAECNFGTFRGNTDMTMAVELYIRTNNVREIREEWDSGANSGWYSIFTIAYENLRMRV